MGWKTFKEHFKIEHIVQIRDGALLISSPYVSNLVSISLETGKATLNDTFKKSFTQTYPQVLEAKPEQIKELIDRMDIFERSITVYTHDGLHVITKQCEELGYPNVTHDGVLMYENYFSTDKDEVIKWAKQRHALRLEQIQERVQEKRAELTEWSSRLEEVKQQQLTFD